jgi:hypothetical protein
MTRPFLVGIVLISVSFSSAAAQTYIGRKFLGSTFSVDSNSRQPDTMGAAGVDHFVELINGRYSVYRKSDGVRVQTSTQNGFWNNAGQTPTGINGSFDPRVTYDPYARRWYAVAVDNATGPNNFLFAVSSSSDPTQPWTAFKIDSDADDSNWADFPMLGYNGEGVYVSTFMPTLGAAPSRTSLIGFLKFELLQPVPSIANSTHFQDVDEPTAGFIPQLAVDINNTFGDSMPTLAMSAFGGGSLIRADITPLGSPAIVNRGFIFENAVQPPTVVQPGAPAVQNLESNDWRFSSNTVLRNGEMYAVQTIDDLSALGRATVRFLRIDAVNNNVQESVVLNHPSLALTFPSIAVNEFGDVVIGATGTSTTEFASSYALVRRAGSGVFDPLQLRAGVANYVNLDSLNRNRWGDYSATTVDPADPSIFWTTQEYVSGANVWSTQMTELILPRSAEARWAEPLDGVFNDPTMWLTAHGGAPLPPDHAVFSRATDPGSSITISFPPAPLYVSQSASIRQGNVRLDLAGNQWDLALHLEVGPYYGHPQATVANGTINSVAGFIAGRPTSEGHLTLDNATWSVSSALTIGSAPAPGSAGILPGAFGGAGSLTIENNSEVDVGGTLTLWQSAVVNLTDGVLTAAAIDNGGKFNFTGGTLHVDNFNGELRNGGGTLAPGTSIGTTSIMPGYFQFAGGTLAIEIGGTGAADYDRLITGLASLDGRLGVSLLAGFAPSVGDTFDILDFGGIMGSFASISLPMLAGGRRWDVSQLYVSGALSVLPPFDADFDEDRDVDGNDLASWKTGIGASGSATHMQGDADGDLDVDGADFLVWQRQFGSFATAAAAVPEPTTLGLLVAGMLAMLFRQRVAVW